MTTATTERRGDWILTASGQMFWPLDPSPAEVELDDIALALSQICRWTGHTRWHYSVAQHAVLVARLVETFAPDLALAALHHDSAEAYVGDISRPMKRCMALSGFPFEQVEDRVRQAIAAALSLPKIDATGEAIIANADNLVLMAEYRDLLPAHDDFPRLGTVPGSVVIVPMSTHEARSAFLNTHHDLKARIQENKP